jgi:hypothetical protein
LQVAILLISRAEAEFLFFGQDRFLKLLVYMNNKGANMDNPIKSSAEWIEAEHFRKTEKFAEALSVFLSFFEKNSDESSLWRAVHCARKIGDFELAFKLIEENKQFLKTSPALNTQLNWLKYEALVDKNKKAGNWEKVLDACEDILQQNNDETDLLFKFTGQGIQC